MRLETTGQRGIVARQDRWRMRRTSFSGLLLTVLFLAAALSTTSIALCEEVETVADLPEHDFPKRIIYRTNPDGTRTIRLDGGSDDGPETGQAMEWHVEAVACPGGLAD